MAPSEQKPATTDGAPTPRSRYRESAVRHYQSPERLDRTASVTDAKGWIGVSVGLVIVGLALAWGILGGIPNQVQMRGEVVRKGAFAEVESPTSGVVAAIVVVPGEEVATGDTLIVVATARGDVDVASPAEGTVQGLSVSTGDAIEQRARIATIVDEESSGSMRTVSYVGPAEAASLRSLPDAVVSPASVDRAQFGSVRGRVTFVSDVPATEDEMTATLQSDGLAQSFLAETGGVPYLVIVTFDDPPQWTNDQRPPFPISDGTPADITATIGVERPIDVLFGR